MAVVVVDTMLVCCCGTCGRRVATAFDVVDVPSSSGIRVHCPCGKWADLGDTRLWHRRLRLGLSRLG